MDLAPTLLSMLLLLMLLLLREQAGALKLLNVSVPSYLRRGESTTLECRYDLESDKLYSVTWYKDNEHIYSFSTRERKKKVHNVVGVKIDQRSSDTQKLRLQSVNLNSTGYYGCEVNNDGPPFKTVRGRAYMEVIELPRDDPKITGEEKFYATGEILALNCTSGFSYPAAQLQWFINDVPVDPDSEVLHLTSLGLHSTRSSLRLELDPLHLADGRIEVKCSSVVRTSPEVKPPFKDIRTTKIYVQGQASLAAPSVSLLLAVLLALALLRKD